MDKDNVRKFQEMRSRDPKVDIRMPSYSPLSSPKPMLRELASSKLKNLGTSTTRGMRDLGKAAGNKIMNIKSRVTQEFGNYNPSIETFSGGINYGTDYAAPVDTPLSAPKGNWQVVEAFAGSKGNRGDNRGYGNSVVLKNLDTGETLRFSHLNNVGVRVGDRLSGDEVVATTGSTGNSTGPHLDVQYRDPQGTLRDFQQSPYNNLIG